MAQSQLTAVSTSLVQAILMPQPPAVAGIADMHHHVQLIFFFLFLVEIGFHHVGQAGLELLTSSDLPVSASQTPGITNISYHIWPKSLTFINFLKINNIESW